MSCKVYNNDIDKNVCNDSSRLGTKGFVDIYYHAVQILRKSEKHRLNHLRYSLEHLNTIKYLRNICQREKLETAMPKVADINIFSFFYNCIFMPYLSLVSIDCYSRK